jgi:cell wall-associated NlpC family hydrolase
MTNIVTNLSDLALDSVVRQDGDNSVLKATSGKAHDPVGAELQRLNTHEATVNAGAQVRGLQSAKALYVPFRRNLKRSYVGNDAFAVKRALSRAGYGKWGGWGKYPRLFGSYAVNNLKNFQIKNGLKPTGVYDLATHKKLAPYFDAYGAFLLNSYKHPIKKDQRRDNIVANALFGYHNKESIHYTESSWRGYGVRNQIKPPQIPRYEDCSSFATWCYYAAGVSDPNNLDYKIVGYTGTLVKQGKEVTIQQAQPGDLVFYGGTADVPGHVAIYIGDGKVVSNGSEGGPYLLAWNYRSDVHSIRSYL